MIHKLPPEQEKTAETYYHVERKPLLNPSLFLHRDDEYYIITGRGKHLTDLTLEWCKRHFPGAKEVFVVGPSQEEYNKAATHDDPKFWQQYLENAVMKKVDKIKELELDVYIDDNPTNVKKLREELPHVTIIQYGGRLA